MRLVEHEIGFGAINMLGIMIEINDLAVNIQPR